MHQRRAQVVEHLDEHQRRAGQVARQRQREDHAPEQPPARQPRFMADSSIAPSMLRMAATRFSRMNGK
jgi:hypothetical protein